MSELPRIPAAKPVTVPAADAKTFPDVFMTQMHLTATPGGESVARLHLVPYNYETGEVGPEDESRVVRIAKLKSVAARRAAEGKPALAQALGAVLAAVAELVGEGY